MPYKDPERKREYDRARQSLNRESLSIYNKNWREANKEEIKARRKTYREVHREKLSADKKIWREANKEAVSEAKKKYYNSNKDSILASCKVYAHSENGISVRRARHQNKYRTDPIYRQRYLCRSRFKKWFKSNGLQKSGHIQDLIGCTWEEFCKHLESQFKNGMTWDNQGLWHIDHIWPLAWFDPLNSEHQQMAWHYTNLQPLWAAENILKSDRGAR